MRKRFFSFNEAAKICGVPVYAIQGWVESGKVFTPKRHIEALRRGPERFFDAASLRQIRSLASHRWKRDQYGAKIVALLKRWKGLTCRELSERAGISRSSCTWVLQRLMERKVVKIAGKKLDSVYNGPRPKVYSLRKLRG